MKNNTIYFIILIIIINLNNVFSEELKSYRFSGDFKFNFYYTYYKDNEKTDFYNDYVVPQNDFINELDGYFDLYMSHRINLDKVLFFIGHSIRYYYLNQTPIFEFSLQEAFVDITPVSWFYTRIGKQLVNWSTGYFFTPTDILNENKNVFDIHANREGFTGITIGFMPFYWFNIQICSGFAKEDFNFGDIRLDSTQIKTKLPKWIDNRYALMFYFLAKVVDIYLSLNYQYNQIFRPGLGIRFDLFGFIFNIEGAIDLHNRQYYFSYDKYIDGIKSYDFDAEYYYQKPLWSPFYFLDVGVQKTFTFGESYLSFVLEYYFNYSGYNREESWNYYRVEEELRDTKNVNNYYLLMDQSKPGSFGQHYIFHSVIFQFENYFKTENYILWNITDLSFYLYNDFSIIYIDNLDIKIFGITKYGDNKSEYGFTPGVFTIGFEVEYHF